MVVDVEKTFSEIKQILHDSGDLKTRDVQFFATKIKICYLADITDSELLNLGVVNPLVDFPTKSEDVLSDIRDKVLASQEVKEFDDITSAIENILKGYALILIDGTNKILGCDVEKITTRAVAEPPTNVVIKGPREGFNESIKNNLALIRKRVKTDDLVVTTLDIGKLTNTQVAVVYFDSVADKRVVKHILKRLKDIDIDGIIDSHYLVSYLQKNPKSLFKQVGDTEKPDILVGKMLEGRVGILVDGSPIALTLPFLLIEDLQNSDDYYSQPIRVGFIRILRLVGVVLAVLLPGVYVALEKFHYKIIPINFLVTIMNTTQGIPFSPFLEILFVVLLFEILYEANLRMPQYFGMAMSIVGALILGETAVAAGLVSPPAVMIVALSGITFYIVPSQVAQFSILRLIGVLIGALSGIYGLLVLCVFTISYLSSFDSYYTPYLAPTTPHLWSDYKDMYKRVPIKMMKKRPKSVANSDENMIRRGEK